MFETRVLDEQDRRTAEERLWRAVIARTLEEWVRGPLRYSRKAEEFLFNDNSDFLAVCSSAGMNADDLRRRLRSIRARGFRKLSSQLPFRGRKKPTSPTRGVFEQNFDQKLFSV